MMVRWPFIFVKRGFALGAKWTSAVFRDKGQSRLNVLKKKKKYPTNQLNRFQLMQCSRSN